MFNWLIVVEFLSSRLSLRYPHRLPVEKPPLSPVHKFPLSVVDRVSFTSAGKAQFISSVETFAQILVSLASSPRYDDAPFSLLFQYPHLVKTSCLSSPVVEMII